MSAMPLALPQNNVAGLRAFGGDPRNTLMRSQPRMPVANVPAQAGGAMAPGMMNTSPGNAMGAPGMQPNMQPNMQSNLQTPQMGVQNQMRATPQMGNQNFLRQRMMGTM
jgi:hypothetical protein